jgi:hypothetical protein
MGLSIDRGTVSGEVMEMRSLGRKRKTDLEARTANRFN